MKGKRSGVEFKDHELSMITIWGPEPMLIHDFKKPDTITHRVKFINTNGIMVVIGDFGHWMFCREFHPSENGNVSDHYWIEKCDMEGQEYDSEATSIALNEGLQGGLVDYGYYGEKLERAKQYYEGCLRHTDTDWEYVAFAHGSDKPDFIDHGDVPYCKRTKPWLNAVFDAFDEICRRIKEEGE